MNRIKVNFSKFLTILFCTLFTIVLSAYCVFSLYDGARHWLIINTISFPDHEQKAREYTEGFHLIREASIALIFSEFSSKRIEPILRDSKTISDVANVLSTVEQIVLTQRDIPHIPFWWLPSLVTGLGWCNDVNGVAARILSYFFQAETYALVTNRGISNHTIGRYFDTTKARWIYFDIWPGRILMFEWDLLKSQKIHFIVNKKSSVSAVPAISLPSLLALYEEGLPNGRVHHRFDSLAMIYHMLRTYKMALLKLMSSFGPPKKQGPKIGANLDFQPYKENPISKTQWETFLKYRLNFIMNGIRPDTDGLDRLQHIPKELKAANAIIMSGGQTKKQLTEADSIGADLN